MYLDTKDFPDVENFEISAALEYDESGWLEDSDCYSETDKMAWQNNHWEFVVVIVTASREGIVLGTDVLGGCEHGYSVDWDSNAFDRVTEYDMIANAVADARANLARINARD